MGVSLKHIVKNGFRLAKQIEHVLADAEDPDPYHVVEAVVEAIAEAAGMVAVTRDDLPLEEVVPPD